MYTISGTWIESLAANPQRLQKLQIAAAHQFSAAIWYLSGIRSEEFLNSKTLQELRRCANMGFRGVEIGSHVGEKSLDHKDFWPLYKECENLGVVLFVHPWDMHNWDGRLAKYWMPWLVGKL
ncbi:hypothetical protein ANCCEY_07614 [Ancylostoma ceylanicum]|uniref:2-amino-3-carboxymuconate-6-semialdehyde decarboxylase n=1 Tax=Ancylostoma ceylanicum TaxID=53326 RepID=A0A0D6LTF3_9BILA|nr:hypothetical protein ANCCEY_07614 [Ancylostoma ceylanicum]